MQGKLQRRALFASVKLLPLALMLMSVSVYAYRPDDSDSVVRASTRQSHKKYLLSIGIIAYRQGPLTGCVNDATNMMNLLTGEFGFDAKASRLLKDYEATRANIIGSIEQYTNITTRGDLFVLFYSGHGCLFPDNRSLVQDETEALDLSYLRNKVPGFDLPNGYYDSALVPVDASARNTERRWGNLILDDELFDMFSRMTAKGVNVILISDSCHSGTLAKSLDVKGEPKLLDPETVLGVKLNKIAAPENIEKISNRQMSGLYLGFTASQDNQASLDSPELKQGYFTYAIMNVISRMSAIERKRLTYKGLYNACKPIVEEKSGRTQSPKLDSRYYGRSLDEPLFSSSVTQLPQPAQPAQPYARRVRVRFVAHGRNGEVIPNSSLALFRPEIQSVPEKGHILPEQMLLILRTSGAGEAIGEAELTLPGEYWIKVVCVGYESRIQRVRLTEDPQQRGYVKLVVVLDPE